MPRATISRTVVLTHRVTGSGPPLLLVAGTGYPGATWPPEFVDRLAAHCTVIMFDHRGTGTSPATDGPYTTRLFAADAGGLLDRLGVASAPFWSNRPHLEHYLKHVVARQEHETTALLPQIDHPALVLVGDRDTHVGGTGSHWEQSRYLAEHLPDAKLEVLPGIRHGLFWAAPAETAAVVVSWVAERDGPASGGSGTSHS